MLGRLAINIKFLCFNVTLLTVPILNSFDLKAKVSQCSDAFDFTVKYVHVLYFVGVFDLEQIYPFVHNIIRVDK